MPGEPVQAGGGSAEGDRAGAGGLQASVHLGDKQIRRSGWFEERTLVIKGCAGGCPCSRSSS